MKKVKLELTESDLVVIRGSLAYVVYIYGQLKDKNEYKQNYKEVRKVYDKLIKII